MITYDSSIIYDTPDYTYDGYRLIIVDENDTVTTNDNFCCISLDIAQIDDTSTTSEEISISLDLNELFDNSIALEDDLDIKASYNPQFEDTAILDEDYKIKIYYNGIEIIFEDRTKTDSKWTIRNKTVDITYKTRNKPWLP